MDLEAMASPCWVAVVAAAVTSSDEAIEGCCGGGGKSRRGSDADSANSLHATRVIY